MKKNKWFTMLLMAAMCVLGFTSCSDDDDDNGDSPDTPSEELADYTILLYGCGGSNLDDCLLFNLQQIDGMGYNEKVRFTGLVKFSQPYQNDVKKQGTRLFNMTPGGMEDSQVADISFRLKDPQNLANFIVDAQKRMPAKKYIIIFWNHGNTFDKEDNIVLDSYTAGTRSLLYDDNTDETMSIFEVEEAMKRAENLGAQKLSLVYWDVCLMNMIENIYQIKDHTDYVMGAGHLTPGLGGNYPELINALSNNDTLEDALREYVPVVLQMWRLTEGNDATDLSVINTAKLEPLVQGIREYSQQLYDIMSKPDSQEALRISYVSGCTDEKRPFYAQTSNLYFFYSQSTSVDLISTLTIMAHSYPGFNGTLSASATKVRKALDEATLIKASNNLPSQLEEVGIGIHWMWTEDYEATVKNVYPHLAFDKVAGWSRFMANNPWRIVSLDTSTLKFSLVAVPTWTLSWSLVTPGDLTENEQQSIGQYLARILTPQELAYHKQMQVEAAERLAYTLSRSVREAIIKRITAILKETRPNSTTVPEFTYRLTLKSDDPSTEEYIVEITDEDLDQEAEES